MRAAFVQTITELAERDRRILLLTGDLGFMALEPFSDRFPDRFFNAGVAEQNMIGMATGLAEAGFLPFAYSIATFATLRGYEFIRNGPILHRLPVRVVGMGGGFDYGSAGPTHHAIEDMGVLRLHPGMTVVAPADSEQTRAALRATWDYPGPIYFRLGKDDRLVVPGLNGRFELGRVQVIADGGDLLIIAVGSAASEAVAAADTLIADGIRCTVLVVSTFNPSPEDDLAEALARFPAALTVEAHYVVGGLGSLVSEIVAERGIACRVVRCGVRQAPDGRSGSQPYMLDRHGIARERLVQSARTALQRVPVAP